MNEQRKGSEAQNEVEEKRLREVSVCFKLFYESLPSCIISTLHPLYCCVPVAAYIIQ